MQHSPDVKYKNTNIREIISGKITLLTFVIYRYDEIFP